uniref:Odorant receptor n=1 Tax=Lobesia botrana TaxID=209534 RepID=A0A345BET5_9NEOP|nr:odorant receptors OR2.3 [Lobesia botrana]
MLTRIYNTLKGKFDDSDVDSHLDYQYIKRQRLLMSTIGCWPHKQFKNKHYVAHSMYNILLISVAFLLPVLEVGYLWQHWRNITFFDFGHDVLCILMAILVLQRLFLSRTNKYYKMIKMFLFEFHLFYFKERSQYNAKIYKVIHIVSGMFTLYVQCLMGLGLILFTFKPWYNNYSRGLLSDNPTANITLEQAVYYYSPNNFAYTTKTGYWILFTANMPLSYFVTCGLCGFDLLVSTIVFQILGHLQILKHNLMTIPLPLDVEYGIYSIEENIQIRRRLKENIEHHKVIIKFVDKCSDALNEYSFLFYLVLQIMCCVLLLEISAMTSDALAKYGPMTLGMYQQLVHLSVFFELVSTKSAQLINVVYALPWECMDTGNRKTVMFLL